MYILLIIFVFAGGQTTAKTVLTTKQACVATKAVGERSSFLDFEASKPSGWYISSSIASPSANRKRCKSLLEVQDRRGGRRPGLECGHGTFYYAYRKSSGQQ